MNKEEKDIPENPEYSQTSSENSKDLKTKHKKSLRIKELEAELTEANAKMLRIAAEFENYKKRIKTEQETVFKYANMDLIDKLIQPLDQLRTVAEMPTENELLKNFLVGFKMLSDQIFSLLESEGITKISPNIGDDYDPMVHSALEKVESTQPENTITKIIQNGYTYKDRLLRPAMVEVSKGGN